MKLKIKKQRIPRKIKKRLKKSNELNYLSSTTIEDFLNEILSIKNNAKDLMSWMV